MKKLKLRIIMSWVSCIILFSCAQISFAQDSIDGSNLNLKDLSKLLSTNFLEQHSFTEPNRSVDKSTNPIRNSEKNNSAEFSGLKKVTRIYNGTDHAGFSIPGLVGITLGKKEQCLIAYFIDFKKKVINKDTVIYGYGYSVHFIFKKVKKGISITDLANLAASAQLDRDKTQVSYTLQTYGIRGSILAEFFKPDFNTDYDVRGYASIQSSAEGIHKILSNPDLLKKVEIRPEPLTFLK